MNVITEDIGDVVELMRPNFITADLSTFFADSTMITADGGGAPYYMYDTRLNISNILKEKGKSPDLQWQRYPLIALRLPVVELVVDGFIQYKLNIGMFAFTKKSYTTQQRMDLVIKPLLGRMYDMFFEELRNSGLFYWGTKHLDLPKHTKVIRPYWGTQGAEGNEANIFSDPLDAIEIVDLEVKTKIRC